MRTGIPHLARPRSRQIDHSLLVKLIGFPATLIHGDTLVLDRWLWLRRRLSAVVTKDTELIDIGCGTGAFTIGAALKGGNALGLSWDARNQTVARERAGHCGASRARFEVLDVRNLDERSDLVGRFDVAILCEVIEHIIDDEKLIIDTARTLKPGGRLLLTTPNIDYMAITKDDNGPFCPVEDGRHVRRGYNEKRLRELAAKAGLAFDRCSYCSGFASQKTTAILRQASRIHPLFGWLVTFPLRILPPLLDPVLNRTIRWPLFSICAECHKE